ncbi:MAG: glycosyl transferase family 2 [Phycisphaerae bacterium]|nr:glycosyl transferase family 2 [Phycisphaerae bacterium]
MTEAPTILLVSPCRDEIDHVETTIKSILAQTLRPTKWIIVDDGSTDGTQDVLARYANEVDFIEVVSKPDTGERRVGPGVIESFYVGLESVDWRSYEFICKLDVDLDLPPTYLQGLVDKLRADPSLGTCSGKPWFRRPGTDERLPEPCGDEMSVGMTKFYRSTCFDQIGGFERAVMWDGIDCHRCRMLGWRARAFNDADLAFEHLRPMGSSHKSIWTGRQRHGRGQWYMGTSPWYLFASAASRLFKFPVVIGSAAMVYGYLAAAFTGKPRLADPATRKAIRRYQWLALTKGKPWLADFAEPRSPNATTAAGPTT